MQSVVSGRVSSSARPGDQVWVDAGRDDALAREILSEIAERVAQQAKREAPPAASTPKEDAEKSIKFGDALKP